MKYEQSSIYMFILNADYFITSKQKPCQGCQTVKIYILDGSAIVDLF